MARLKRINITGTAASLIDPQVSDTRLMQHLVETSSSNVLTVTAEGITQTRGLYEKGIWVCECKHLNPLELYQCKKCNETRLIILPR